MTAKSKKVRCLVCNEILTYDNDDTSVLVDHLNMEHSGLDVFRFLAHCQVASSPRINKRGQSRENCSMEAGDVPSDYGLKTKTYKTTVETWTPGPNSVVCPKCSKEGQPIVKKQKNKMAKSPIGALCMLGCWPFCFLPFLFRKDQFLDLYCPSCKCYLGTYDKRKHCMTRSPNKTSDTSLCARRVSAESDDQPIPVTGQLPSNRERSAMSTNCQRAENAGIPPPLYDSQEDFKKLEQCACVRTPVPSYGEISYAPKAESTATTEKSSLLPSYSSIMKNPPDNERCADRFHHRTAPPTYNDVPGVYVIPSSRQFERLCTIPSLPETQWSSHSQPAYCPRCDVLILTMTRTQESLATHVAALALCLFGCWPCCLLPYCLNICKNTYHLCPICKRYLGAYTPW